MQAKQSPPASGGAQPRSYAMKQAAKIHKMGLTLKDKLDDFHEARAMQRIADRAKARAAKAAAEDAEHQQAIADVERQYQKRLKDREDAERMLAKAKRAKKKAARKAKKEAARVAEATVDLTASP